jgi:hypothetical protein
MSTKMTLALSALTIALSCGGIFGRTVQQESLGDVARRIRAEKEQKTRQVKNVDVYQGSLTFKAIPAFSDAQKQSINGMEIRILNSSPLGYRFALTAKCAQWTNTISGNIEGSAGAPKQKTISVDLPSACRWSDASLEQVREAEGLEGPEPHAPKVEGIDDAELARQAKIEKVVINDPNNSISELLRRADQACKQQPLSELATAPASSISDHVTACAKANDAVTAALQTEGARQSRAGGGAVNQSAPGGLEVRLTGTAGVPFTGSCSFSNRGGTISQSYDDVLPFQTTAENVITVGCSFISKAEFLSNMKLEIIKDGRVIGESHTDAHYGVVSVMRDLN